MSHQDGICLSQKARPCLSLNKKTLFQQKLILTPIKHEDESINPVDTRSSAPFCGLINLGNTCYINSIIQVLRFCPGFTQSLQNTPLLELTEPRVSTMQTQSSLIVQLKELLNLMAQLETEKTAGHSPVVSPTDFVNQLKDSYAMFSGSSQHDAQELLKVLLVGIQEMTSSTCTYNTPNRCLPYDSGTQLSDSKGKLSAQSDTQRKRERQKTLLTGHCSKKRKCLSNGTIQCRMTDYLTTENEPIEVSTVCSSDVPQETGIGLFQGSLVYQTVCIECEHLTQRTESFLDVSVPVVASHSFDCFGQQSSPVKTTELSATVGPYSLSWALSQFAKREKLRSNNKYWCGHCRHLVEAERSILFSKLPPVLTFHLNRFSMQSISVFSKVGKIGGNIATPLFLCLSPWCTSDCPNRLHMYALFAVVFHTGSSCHGGHYTACVRAKNHHSSEASGRQPTSNGWLLFDDDHVTSITQAKLLDMLSPLSSSSATAYMLFYALK